MAFSARRFVAEPSVEDRITRLEEKTDHMQADIAAIKSDIRRIDATIAEMKDSFRDALNAMRVEMKESISALRNDLTASIGALRIEMKDSVAELRKETADLRVSRWIDRVWWLTTSGVLLGIMARAFMWI